MAMREGVREGLCVLALAMVAACPVGCGRSAAPEATQAGTPSARVQRATAFPEPDVSGYSFSDVVFAQEPSVYVSGWKARAKSVTVTPQGAGLRCDVAGGRDTSGGQYGGIKFPVEGLKALRLTMTFEHVENIDAVIVDGCDAAGERVLRWRWLFGPGRLPQGSSTYTFVPGQPSRYFECQQGGPDSGDSVRRVDVFLRLRVPGSRASLVLQKAEVAE